MTGIALIPVAEGNAYDLDLGTGHITLAEVTHQNQAMLLTAAPGEYKACPAAGIGLRSILHDHDFSGWRRRIREQLEADGQRITRLQINEQGLILEAEYK